jgi:thiol:disulfide interchange protein DsbD
METLKQFFAFPMMATALWLMWVFMLQTSGDALIQLLVLSLALAISIWMIATFNNAFKWIGLTLTVVAGIQFFTNIPVNQIDLEQGASNSGWDVLLESDLQAQNQAYLINFTAAWCITCQANEKTSLGRASVKKYLVDNNIKYIKADWTNRDENITKSLSKYGRSGVPLYVFWKPGMQRSKILPAVLTEAILIRGMQ